LFATKENQRLKTVRLSTYGRCNIINTQNLMLITSLKSVSLSGKVFSYITNIPKTKARNSIRADFLSYSQIVPYRNPPYCKSSAPLSFPNCEVSETSFPIAVFALKKRNGLKELIQNNRASMLTCILAMSHNTNSSKW
jgi:hypothetical protein